MIWRFHGPDMLFERYMRRRVPVQKPQVFEAET
jgi:hypothetical protein